MFVLLGAIGQFAAGFLPDMLGWEQTIVSRSAQTNTLLIPGGFAFVIWLPLFIGAVGFGCYCFSRQARRDPEFIRVASIAGLAYWANTVRSLYEPAVGPGWISFALLLAILIPLLVASLRAAERRRASRGWHSVALLPVYGQAGWISVATAAGLTQTAAFTNFDPLSLGALSAAVVTLVAFLPFLLIFSWRLRSLAYAGAAGWGLFWIYAINEARGLGGLSMLALTGAGALLAAAAFSKFAKRQPSPPMMRRAED